MRKPLQIISFIALTALFISCEKEAKLTDNLDSAFDFADTELISDQKWGYYVPTFTTITTLNKTEETVNIKYNWDFGNGKASTEKSPTFFFEKAGDYNVALNVSNGQNTASSSKKIHVVDRLIKSVQITQLNRSSSFHNLVDLNGFGDDVLLYVKIFAPTADGKIPEIVDNQYNSDVIFQSEKLKLSGETVFPVQFNVNDNKAILVPPQASAYSYGYCLYASTKNGEYLLLSNWGSVAVDYYESLEGRISRYSVGFDGTEMKIEAAF